MLSLLLSLLVSLPTLAKTEKQNLTQKLEKMAAASASRTPKEIKKVMSQAIEDLKKSNIEKKAKKKGDKIPHFSLKDPIKGSVDSKKLLQQGPLILTFYRGSWCPYCNLQLRDLQTHLPKIKSLGAQLVAISPEAPDRTLKHVKKQKLDFYVLSDVGGTVIKSFGLMYELPKELIKVYEKFGINLPKANKSKGWTLPLSATYIINKEGEIVYSFLDSDYKKRAETKELIKILGELKK